MTPFKMTPFLLKMTPFFPKNDTFFQVCIWLVYPLFVMQWFSMTTITLKITFSTIKEDLA